MTHTGEAMGTFSYLLPAEVDKETYGQDDQEGDRKGYQKNLHT